jgi:acetyl-CoA synthetase
LLDAASPVFQAVAMHLDDLAVLQYTSGSTGNPKGATLSNRFVLALYPYARYALNIREDDVFWDAADPGWAYGPLRHGKCYCK